MRFHTLPLVGLVLVGTLATGVPAVAGDDKPKPQMTAEQQAAMDAWMKAATPGENHKLLDPMVGSWNAKTTMWEAPGAPPQVSSGTSENVWVLGGRFVQQTFKGTFGGMAFEGIGFTGYDNYKKKFVGTWMDTMGTMVLIMTGAADASGKVLTMEGSMDDVVARKPTTVRTVSRVVDKDTVTYEMYGPDPTGKEYKMMEIVYTRK